VDRSAEQARDLHDRLGTILSEWDADSTDDREDADSADDWS
jgi:hypothetical protein